MSEFLPLGNTIVTRGYGLQNDARLSSLTVNCDMGLIGPAGNTSNFFRAPESGKAAIGVDICDLEVANLKVNGTLTVNIVIGPLVLEGCLRLLGIANGIGGDPCQCVLYVENQDVAVPQAGDAFCAIGSSQMKDVITNTTKTVLDLSTVSSAFTDKVLKVSSGVANTNGLALVSLDTDNLTAAVGLEIDGGLTVGTGIAVTLAGLTTGTGLEFKLLGLTIGTGIAISLAALNGAGRGIDLEKTGSTMVDDTRLASFVALTENGAAPTDSVTLVDVNGPSLRDNPADNSTAPTTYKSALWVNCTTSGAPPSTEFAPVGALWVDGGTVFRGLNSNPAGGVNSHGHIHSALVLPPKPLSGEDNIPQVNISMDLHSTDTAGSINVTVAGMSLGAGVIRLLFAVQYPSYALPTRPIVIVTASSNYYSDPRNKVSVDDINRVRGALPGPVPGLYEAFDIVLDMATVPVPTVPDTSFHLYYHVIGLVDAVV